MRRTKLSLAASVAAAAAVVLVLVPPLGAQSLEEVLEAHYEAMGGLDAWLDAETVSMSGSISLLDGVMEGPFEIIQKRPTLSRMTVTVQGQEIVQAFDGETAWQIVPMLGQTAPTEADPATAAEIRDQADFDGPLIGWEEDGHEVELVGNTTVDGTEYLELRVRLAHGTEHRYFLDPETYIPIRIESSSAQGATTSTLSDYRDIGGLEFPFLIEIDTPMGRNVLTLESVELDAPFDDSIFSMDGS